jgi:hypothetical protein
MTTSTYLLWVNADSTILVRWWPGGDMEVSTRPDSHAIWGPPQELKMEPVQ